jgi:large subunit ribosomal protein L4
MPKKMRRGALRSALSERVREGNVIVVDGWTLDKPKTKELVGSLGQLGFGATRTLIVDSLDNENLILSARNVQQTKIVNSFGLNIYDLLYHEKLILSRAAAEELEKLLRPKSDTTEAVAEKTEEQPVEAAVPVKPKRARKPKEEVA